MIHSKTVTPGLELMKAVSNPTFDMFSPAKAADFEPNRPITFCFCSLELVLVRPSSSTKTLTFDPCTIKREVISAVITGS